MRIFCFEKNIYLNSIKNDHAGGCRSGCGLIRSILGILELSSEKNHNFITIWKSWFSYEFPLIKHHGGSSFNIAAHSRPNVPIVRKERIARSLIFSKSR